MAGFKTVVTTMMVLVLGTGVLIGGWLGGWWLREDAVQRTAEINETTFARQTALQEEVLSLNRDVRNLDVQLGTATDEQKPALQAQRRAIMDRLCDAHARMTGAVQIPDSVTQLVNQECF